MNLCFNSLLEAGCIMEMIIKSGNLLQQVAIATLLSEELKRLQTLKSIKL